MRVITGLPRLTPIPILQAEAQLNTLDELIGQRRQARALRIGVVPAAAALAHYMNPSVPLVDPPDEPLPPWRHYQVTDYKPLGCLRKVHSGSTPTGVPVLPPAVPVPDNVDLVAYVDAGMTSSLLHTGLVCPSFPTANQTCSYLLDAPLTSVLAELIALRDGLTAILPIIAMHRPTSVIFYTDSMQAVRALRRVDRSFSAATDFHRVMTKCPCPVRVCWIRRSSVPAHAAADAACHPRTLVHPLPLLKTPATDSLAIHKETLRRATRALIPPCGADLPGGLTRLEEVSLRRIRVNAAVTPAVRASWNHAAASTCCPFCPAPVREADLEHLLWTCPGLQGARRRHLARVGLHPSRPPDYNHWTHGPHHRSLLNFLKETGLHFYL